MNSHTVLKCRIGLDWLVLPAPDIWGLVELILIYQFWGYVFLVRNSRENFDLISNDASINTNDWVDCCLRWYLYRKAKQTQITRYLSKPFKSDSSTAEENFALKSINLLIILGKKKELPEEWKRSILLPLNKKGNKNICIN